MFQGRFIFAFFLGLICVCPAWAQETNGAVPGLLPPLTELQAATRLEHKTLVQFADILLEEGRKARRFGGFKLGREAEGVILLGGVVGDDGSMKFDGLNREIQPIKTHLDRLVLQVLAEVKLTDAQKAGLSAWKARVDEAFALCDKEPTLRNLRSYADSLIAITEALAEFDSPEVAFLEAGLDAWKLGRSVENAGSYFSFVLKAHKAELPKAAALAREFDGISIDPEKYTGKDSDKILSGLDARFVAWIGRIQKRLKSVSEKKFSEQIGQGEKLKAEISTGSWESLQHLMDWSDGVYQQLYGDDKMAPVMLRHSQMLLINSILTRFTKLGQIAGEGRKNGASSATFNTDEFVAEVENLKTAATVRITKSGELGFYLEETRRLAHLTLRESKLEAADRKTLEKAITAIEEVQKEMGEAIQFKRWSEWARQIYSITELYRF